MSLILFAIERRAKMSKGITDVDNYKFKLSDELKAVAETELRETKSARDFGLKALRDWIKTNPRIIAVRLGKNRAKKKMKSDGSIYEVPSLRHLTNDDNFIAHLHSHSHPDSSFLLRFLRAKKFSVPITQEAIERYLLLRHSYEVVFTNLDMNLPNMKTLINLGYVASMFLL